MIRAAENSDELIDNIRIRARDASDQQDEIPSNIAEADVSASPEVIPEPVETVKEESEPEELIAEQPALDINSETVQLEATPTTIQPTINVVPDREQEFDISELEVDTVEPDESVPTAKQENIAEPANIIGENLSRFQQELNHSLNWIEASDKKYSTIQIMTIGFDSFAESSYYDYLDKPARQKIDISEIKIFQTIVAGRVVYSVFYGEYQTRRDANKGIELLPEALKANKPIPRTIGGIWDEVN